MEESLVDVEPTGQGVQVPPSPDAFVDATEVQLDVSNLPVRSRGVASNVDPRVMEALRYAGAELRDEVCEGPGNTGLPYKRYVRWFGSYAPSPWCAFFVSWCWDNATDRNRRVPWDNPGWVPSIHSWASQHVKLVDRPQTGDLFGVEGEHIGWVWSAGNGAITTIEGNTSSGCVRSNQRPLAGLWFARIS